MNKSILILDTPKNCGECYIYYHAGFYCEPEHCPLISIPLKKDISHYIQRGDANSFTHFAQYMHGKGWNDCLDEILNKEK